MPYRLLKRPPRIGHCTAPFEQLGCCRCAGAMRVLAFCGLLEMAYGSLISWPETYFPQLMVASTFTKICQLAYMESQR